MTDIQDDSDESIPPFPVTRFLAALAVVLAIVSVTFYFASPLFKGVLMTVYVSPWLVLGPLLLVLTTIGLALSGVKLKNSLRVFSGETGLTFVLIVALTFVMVGAGAFGTLSGHALGQETMENAVEIDQMYEADADHPRIVTRAQANRWAAGSVRSSKYNPTENAIVVYDNKTHWGSNLAPTSSLRNKYLSKQDGTILVNAESFEKDVKVIRGEMKVGRGMGLTDSIEWQLNDARNGPYLVTYHFDVTRTIIHNDEQYLAVPYTKPKHQLLPLPYSHPSIGGVALVDAEGNIDHLTLAEARENPVLAGQPLLPPAYVREAVASTTYRAGIIDTLPVIGSYSETISVAPVPGENNDQPFYLRTNQGGQYVIAVEPTGDTQGLRELWFVDVRTGEFARYESNQSDTLYGPRKSADFVIDANDRVDWDKFTPSEPIPSIVDGELYWQFRVVQSSGGGITFVSFVNAHSQTVVNIEDGEGASAVTEFMRGSYDGSVVSDRPDTTTRTPDLIIEKRNADGEVLETLYVYENETVVTRPYHNETAPNGTTSD